MIFVIIYRARDLQFRAIRRDAEERGRFDSLTHEILVIIVIGVVNDPVAVPLIESAQSAGVIVLGVDGATALEARLSEALVQALAQAASGDLRVKLPAQTRIPISLERGIRPTSVGEQVGRRATVRIFRAAR